MYAKKKHWILKLNCLQINWFMHSCSIENCYQILINHLLQYLKHIRSDWQTQGHNGPFIRMRHSLLRKLNCPVLENEWENGERTGSDSNACQISTRWWPSVLVGSHKQIQFVDEIVVEFEGQKPYTGNYNSLLVFRIENGIMKTYPAYSFNWILSKQQRLQ